MGSSIHLNSYLSSSEASLVGVALIPSSSHLTEAEPPSFQWTPSVSALRFIITGLHCREAALFEIPLAVVDAMEGWGLCSSLCSNALFSSIVFKCLIRAIIRIMTMGSHWPMTEMRCLGLLWDLTWVGEVYLIIKGISLKWLLSLSLHHCFKKSSSLKMTVQLTWAKCIFYCGSFMYNISLSTFSQFLPVWRSSGMIISQDCLQQSVGCCTLQCINNY